MPRLTSKGQVTIPVEVRFALGIAPGDDVVFAVEDGGGVLWRSVGALGRAGALPPGPDPPASPLERLLSSADDVYAAAIAEARRRRRPLPLPDAVVLAIAARLAASPRDVAMGARILRDVLAERGLRVDHRRALSAAIDALARGDDPLAAYADERA